MSLSNGASRLLYLSHLHRDHFDPDWLAAHVDKRATVLLPPFEVPFLERPDFRARMERYYGQPLTLALANLIADGLSALAVETDDATGLAVKVGPVRLGGILEEAKPTFWD